MNTLDKLNSFVGREHDADNFHCYTYLEECLNVPKLNDVHVDTAKKDVEKYIDMFEEIDKPVNFCIVLIGKHHIGAYYNGGIFHNDTMGVRYQSLRDMKFRYNSFRYFLVKD